MEPNDHPAAKQCHRVCRPGSDARVSRGDSSATCLATQRTYITFSHISSDCRCAAALLVWVPRWAFAF
jgi:hypothetical protein